MRDFLPNYTSQYKENNMSRAICLFEDEKWHSLTPLAYFAPVYELRCGIFTLKERIERYFKGDKVLVHSRRYIAESVIGQMYDNILFDPNFSDKWIFINGRSIADEVLVKLFDKPSEDFLLYNGSTLVGAYLTGDNVKKLFEGYSEFPLFGKLSGCKRIETSVKAIENPWDLIKHNGEEIINDFRILKENKENSLKNFDGVVFKNRNQILLGSFCEIEPFVFINAEKGPVVIDDHVKIMSHSTIEGPAYIGSGSTIKSHSIISHNSSIGPVCKVGGEIEDSIIHSYTNKQHYGFLGHSYLGQWINLGAGTTNSDLKNNYGSIRVFSGNAEVDTGLTFLGTLMGDYTKTAIGTRLNTGASIGPCCNIFSDQIVPKYLPPFTWQSNTFHSEYALDKIIETTKVVYSRRGVIFTDSDEKLFREVFNFTKNIRIM